MQYFKDDQKATRMFETEGPIETAKQTKNITSLKLCSIRDLASLVLLSC